MGEEEVRKEIEADLQKAPAKKVIYLEGKTDPGPFFALLGVPTPSDRIFQGVLVQPRGESRGGQAVAQIVDVAIKFGYENIYGIVDGDGRSFSEVSQKFDHPYQGPLFSWKAYSIENLLAKTGWPLAWKNTPPWPGILKDYGPYVALNRIHRDLRASLMQLGIAKLTSPNPDNPLRTSEEVIETLAQGKNLIQGLDVEDRFRVALALFEKAVDENLDEAHTMLNGKWLIEHLAYLRLSEPRSHDRCRFEWCEHARSVGGLPEVQDLWTRITGYAPL